MKIWYPLLTVLVLILVAFVGSKVPGGQGLFGILLPYVALLTFIIFFIKRVVNWGKSPVPFRIPTTCGQEESLPWVKQNKIDNPSTLGGVLMRMALEIFLFRSLFRNTRAEVHDGPKLAYGSSKYLWLFGLLFHYSFLVIVVRHLRLFTNPVPFFVEALDFGDGILQVGVPVLYQTDLIFILAVTFLFLRRVVLPQIRYISLANDYFPLFLIFGIGVTGILMRYFIRVDIVSVKKLTMGLVTLSPSIEGEIGSIFFIHLFLVCVLLAYFPFSKLMHLGGIFLSPTRNLVNNSRKVRHINPWNDPNIKPHSYSAYEDDFREAMAEAGLPLEKELPPPPPEEAPAEEETPADKKED